MFSTSIKGWLCAVVAIAAVSTAAHAGELLVVDLTVPDQVTITATDGLSAVSASGPDFVGVYFEDFYGGPGEELIDSTGSVGDLTSAENPSDGSPGIFRPGSGSDPGLNIWTLSTDSTLTFTQDSLAFVGSATWILSPLQFEDMKNGVHGGNLYFPADSVDDVASAQFLGTYSVIVPEPAALSLLGIGLAVGTLKRRR